MTNIPIEKITIERAPIHPMDCNCRQCSALWWAPSFATGVGCVAIAVIFITINFLSFT